MSMHTESMTRWLIGGTRDGGLPQKLIEECRGFHIFAEEDLQFSSYYHIRKYLATEGVDNEQYWRVYNKKYLKIDREKYGKFPDLTLRRSDRSEILIELKQTIARSVETSEIIEDVIKLTEIGGDKILIALYSCALPPEESTERHEHIINETKSLENMDNLHIVRVPVGATFGNNVEIERYVERLQRLNKERNW